MYLSKEEILRAKGRKFAEADIPAMGGRVRLGGPSAAAALKIREMLLREGESNESQVEILRLAVSCLVDGEGKSLFAEEEINSTLHVIPADAVTDLLKTFMPLINDGTKHAEGAEGNA